MSKHAVLQVLCLLLALHQGGGLKCFESTCLSDPTTCGYDEGVVLRKCNAGVIRDLISELGVVPFPSLLLRLLPMTCLKQVVGDGSVKMCFPKVPRLCQAVGFVTRKITRSEDDASSFLECHSCDTDACNHVAGPPRAAGASLVLGVALVSTLLRRLAVA